MVSAIITTYKRDTYMLMRAVISVLQQSYHDLELIIVDDNGEDSTYRKKTSDYIKTIKDTRVRYIQHEKNMGACAARNTGIEASEGEFIAFLDDDDEWLPQKTEKQLKMMEDPEVGLVYSEFLVIDDETKEETIPNRILYEGFVFDKLIVNNFIGSTSSPLIRKSVFVEIGNFDIKLESSQDLDMWLRISLKYKVKFLREALVKYHVHKGEQISKNPKARIMGLERINEKYAGYLNTHKKSKSIRIMNILPFYIMNKERVKAIKNCLYAIMLSPFNFENNFKGLYHAFIKKFI